MVPFADAFNHAGLGWNQCQLEGRAAEGLAFVMRSIRAVPAGEEVFNTYGPLPSAHLLTSFGFVGRLVASLAESASIFCHCVPCSIHVYDLGT